MKDYIPIIISSIVAIFTIWTFFTNRKKDAMIEINAIKACISSSDKNISLAIERIAKVETSSELGWKMLELYAGKMLHHPTRPEIDYYIDKNEKGELSSKEVKEFMILLHKIMDSSYYTDGEKTAAMLLLAALARRFPELC